MNRIVLFYFRTTDTLFLKLNGILWIMTTLVGLVQHQRIRHREAMESRRHSVNGSYISSIRRGRSMLGERQDLEEFDISMSGLYPRSPPATMWKERISTRYRDTDTWARRIDVPLKAVHVHGRAGTPHRYEYDRSGEMALKSGSEDDTYSYLPPTNTRDLYCT